LSGPDGADLRDVEPILQKKKEGKKPMMKRLGTLLVCVVVLSMAAQAWAELENVDFSGRINVRGIYATNVPVSGYGPQLKNDVDAVFQRTNLGAEATFSDDVSAYIEFQMSDIWGTNAGGEGNLNGFNPGGAGQDVEMYQGYIDVQNIWDYPVALRIGRQELKWSDGSPYGTELLIGDNDFNTGLSFDAVKLSYAEDDLKIDAWWSKLAETGAVAKDRDTDFYGIYGNYSGIEDMDIDAYLLFIRTGHNTGPSVPSGAPTNGQNEQWTLGARVAGDLLDTGVCYNVELATQFGKDGGAITEGGANTRDKDYDGWLLDLLLSYNLDDDYSSSLFAGYTLTTGESDHKDGDMETFIFPFTDNHARWGYADLFGLGNLNAIKVGGSMSPCDDVTVTSQLLFFLTEQEEDLLPVGGGPAPSGSNNSSIAQEWDLSTTYQYTEDLGFELTYGHVFVDSYADDTVGGGGHAEDIDMVYGQAVLTF